MSEGCPHHFQPTSTQPNILVISFPTFSLAPMSPLHLRCLLPLQPLGWTILLPTPSTALISIPLPSSMSEGYPNHSQPTSTQLNSAEGVGDKIV
jgi:hypothetical protein